MVVRGRTSSPRFFMKHALSRLTAGVAVWAAVTSVLAQSSTSNNAPSSQIPQLSTIVVTPARAPEPLGNTLGDNGVMTREDLETLPNGTLGDALIRQHSIETINYGGPQTLNTLNIRGTNSNQSLVLIDGLRINNATNGLPSINAIPLNSVERIEVVRGTNSNQSLVLIDGLRINNATNGLPSINAIPLNSVERIEVVRGTSSSLYGADAIGGVINVITRGEKDRPFSAYANAGVGTYATTQFDAGFSGASDGWVYSLYGGYGQSGGFNTNRNTAYYYNPDKDSYYRSNVGGTLGYTYKPGQTLTLQTFQSTVNGGYDMGIPYFNDRGVQTLSSNMLTSRNVISSLWTSTLRAGFSVDDYKTVGASIGTLDGTQYFKTRQNQYVWQNDLKFSPTQIVSLAYERLEQSVDGTLSNGDYIAPAYVNYQQTSRYTNSLLAIYRGSWGPQSIQASARTDNNSQYGNFVTGSLTYGLDLSKNWRASVGANTGFRAPNFNELYWPVTPFFMGNPLLRPEKSRNIEAGLRYTTDNTQLGLTVYRNEISNLILNQPSIAADPYSPYMPTNIGRATIQGVTLSGNQQLGASTLVRGSFDWLDPRNADTGELLPQRAQQVLKLAVDQSVGRARLTAELYVTSSRRDAFSSDTLAPFSLVNLAASYPVSDHAEVQLRWNNVFGQQYTLVQGYNTPGSNIFVNLALKM